MCRRLWMFLTVLVLSTVLVNCAALEKQWQDTYCNQEEAFSQGFNDGKDGKAMNNGFSLSCPAALQPEVQVAYRKGYVKAYSHRPTEININVGRHREQECHRSFGEQVCGYNCIQAMGRWYCARHPADRCLESFGQVRCGRNCRAAFGKIICDKHHHFR